MKRFRLPLVIVLLGAISAVAAGLISKYSAEKAAVQAVGRGKISTAIQIMLGG